MLQGMTFKDFPPDGPGGIDPVRDTGDIQIIGTGFAGESFSQTLSTDGGYWTFERSYSFNQNDDVQDANVQVCFMPDAGWYQTWPTQDGCHELTLEPTGMAYNGDPDFGAWGVGIARR